MPAVLLGDRDAEQAELLHLLDDRLGELVLVVVVLGVGEDLLVGELADHLDDRRCSSVCSVLRPSCSTAMPRQDHSATLARMNFARDVVDAAPPGRLALVELARDGRRREWTLRRGRRRAAARLAGTLRRAGVGRGDVVMTLIGNRPEWVLRDGRLLPHRRGRAAVHRAAARQGPAAAARRRAPAARRAATSATRASWSAARLGGPGAAAAP